MCVWSVLDRMRLATAALPCCCQTMSRTQSIQENDRPSGGYSLPRNQTLVSQMRGYICGGFGAADLLWVDGVCVAVRCRGDALGATAEQQWCIRTGTMRGSWDAEHAVTQRLRRQLVLLDSVCCCWTGKPTLECSDLAPNDRGVFASIVVDPKMVQA